MVLIGNDDDVEEHGARKRGSGGEGSGEDREIETEKREVARGKMPACDKRTQNITAKQSSSHFLLPLLPHLDLLLGRNLVSLLLLLGFLGLFRLLLRLERLLLHLHHRNHLILVQMK